MMIIVFIFTGYSFAGDTLFKKGENYFLNNQPDKAVSVLEAAIQEDPANFKVYLYLGIAYEQLKKFDKAIEAFTSGIEKTDKYEDLFLVNIGNNYVRENMPDKAIEYYSKALAVKSTNTAALRNRAGEYLRKGNYENALADYKLYLTLDPQAYQKESIEKVINLLENKLDEIARQKLEEERRKLAEEKKQQELLDKVLNSLNNASDDTTNLSAGSEDVEQYTDSFFDIVD